MDCYNNEQQHFHIKPYRLARFRSNRASSASLAVDVTFSVSAQDGSSTPDMSISGLIVVEPSMDWLC
ncbi:hypothetical protein P3L10_001789 [Capsicum annuum]